MKLIQRFATAVLAVLAAGLISACTDRPKAGAEARTEGLAIAGAGATFPAPLYRRWIEEYRREHPGVAFSYESVGSGEGVKRFLAGTVDFGASDAALSDSELEKVDPERGVAMIPMTAGMVVLAYHIPGVGPGLTLARDVYADIFAGRIRSWKDPRILATNPTLSLPEREILTVVRRDSSGTTFAMTNHLAAVDPSWLTQGPGIGKLVDWPGNAMTAVGNEGVARRVQITDGSIGYVEYGFAARLGLPVATLLNKSGALVSPSPLAGQSALGSATEIPDDLRVFLPDPAGVSAYPIVSYSWILLNARYGDNAKSAALKDALAWGLTTGQSIALELGYIPLPETMVAKAQEKLALVQ